MLGAPPKFSEFRPIDETVRRVADEQMGQASVKSAFKAALREKYWSAAAGPARSSDLICVEVG
jgi:hypothetical protein